MSDQPELLPCPFCGGEAKHNGGGFSVFGRDWWTVGCNDCDVWMSDPEVWDKSRPGMLDPLFPPKTCFAAWNRRTPDLIPRTDAELAVVEAIRRAADVGKVVGDGHYGDEVRAAILAIAPADALAEVQRLREAVEALVVVLDRNDKKGPIPDVEMMFCWLAAQGVRAAFRKIAQKGEAT